MEADKRFAKVTRDPRFKKIPRKDRKVKIDSRFEKMFTDKSFTTKYFVDKRGSQVGTTSSEDLHKFYELSDEDEEDEEPNKEINQKNKTAKRKEKKDEGNEKLIKQKKNKENVKRKEENTKIDAAKGLHKEQEEPTKDSNSDNESDSGSDSDYDQLTGIDYARGEGVLESSSSSDYDDDDELTGVNYAREAEAPQSSADEEDIELVPLGKGKGEVEHNWGEMDKNAVTTDQATRRLAVCNLDWDRVTASDLLVLFNSVKPAGGVIHSVKIYPSEIGLERMKSEEQHGPEELQDSDDPAPGTNEEGEAFSQEKLRQYQINRLKYYYAVVDCDSCQTANHLYEECDGVEFELSANILDLRFIPEDMEFDHDPKSACTEMPSVATYEPMNFMTTALNQSKVKITWDETDPGRLRTTMRKFDKKDLLDMDFKAYLASSSDDDDDGRSVDNQEQDSGDDDDDDDDKRIAKYKQLLHDIEKKEEADENENEMAITWEPGLQETAQQLVSRKMKEKAEEKLTPWEKYQKDRKQKRKERREKNKKDKVEKTGKEVKSSGLSDDEIPSDVDMSDPFFNQEFGPGFPDSQVGEANKGEKAKKRRGKQAKELSEENKKKQNELELLMMDEDDNRQHFSLKKIMENEKKSIKKKNRKKGKQDVVTEDTFQINVKDPRFEALYTSHHFSLDPSDPQFRKTKALENILDEKHKRRKVAEEEKTNSEREQRLQEKRKEKQVKDPSLSLLVKSIKSKTGQFHEQKKKRKLPHF